MAITFDEEYWISWVAPVNLANYQTPSGTVDAEEIPVAFLHGQPEEELWQNAVAPILWANFKFAYTNDPEEIPRLFSFTSPDEDYWQNPVWPVFATSYITLPLGDPESEIPGGGNLRLSVDEDYWTNIVSLQAGAFYLWPSWFYYYWRSVQDQDAENLGILFPPGPITPPPGPIPIPIPGGGASGGNMNTLFPTIFLFPFGVGSEAWLLTSGLLQTRAPNTGNIAIGPFPLQYPSNSIWQRNHPT